MTFSSWFDELCNYKPELFRFLTGNFVKKKRKSVGYFLLQYYVAPNPPINELKYI
jgi:hypothetical protein